MRVILKYNIESEMLEDEMTVGPKGQVVIPRAMRKALKIQAGSKVLFRLEAERVILQKHEVDSVGALEAIARKGRSINKISPHEYETELEHRTARR